MNEERASGMTALVFQDASSGMLTLKEASEYLKDNAHLRTVREVLAREFDLDQQDVAAIRSRAKELFLESDSTIKANSIDKNLRSWMKDDKHFIQKNSALQLAFALHLPVEKAETLMLRLSGETFHWRDPEDIIWTYALQRNYPYQQAKELVRELNPLIRDIRSGSNDPGTMTEGIRREIEMIQTDQELASFLKENRNRLGQFHNTAYGLFMEFMNLLGYSRIDDLLPEENKMAVQDIMTSYLFRKYVPKSKDLKEEDKTEQTVEQAIQRDIRQNWPDEFALSRMMNRKTDVTRKVLILLFLACDGGEGKYGNDSDEDPESVFQDTYIRLSSMLADCGFAPLDARAPFDWIALYCMCAEESFVIDENIQGFLREIFPPDETQEEAEEEEEDR